MPEADALLESAATNVVREYLEKRRYDEQAPSPPELSPELIGGLKARVARPLTPLANLVESDDREPAEGKTREPAEHPGAPDDLVAGRRRSAAGGPRELAERHPPATTSELGAAALSIAPADVFRDARAQNKRVFLVNLILGVALASLLVLGIAGLVITIAVFGEGGAGAAFGGVTVLDLLGFAFTKPFAVIQRASVTNQRLDLAHLRLQEQLSDCTHYVDPEKRFRCRSTVWDAIQEELRQLDPA